MITFENRQELVTFFETSGINEVYFMQREDTSNEHIMLNVLNTETSPADNQTYYSITKLQVTFCTRKTYETNKLNLFIEEKFIANSTTTYLDDNEWWNVVFLVDVRVKNWNT